MPDYNDAIRRQHTETLNAIQALVDRARLVLEVDKGWTEVYTKLAASSDDERLERFFAEFSEAHTVESQAAVLERWSV